MTISHLLFVVGVLGFALNRSNLILALLSIEIILLAVSVIVVIGGLSYNDSTGQTFSVLIVAIAGAESAVGLGILVAYYRLRGTVALDNNSLIV